MVRSEKISPAPPKTSAETFETFLDILCCPVSRTALSWNSQVLQSAQNANAYPLTEEGIPVFAEQFCSAEARQQQKHYDKVAADYVANLSYPHTIAYMSYLDNELFKVIGQDNLGTIAEICCGHGEALKLIGDRITRGVGIDISLAMLREARKHHTEDNVLFAQGDATMLPLASDAFDNVFMLGGIHHVNDRQGLFKEIARILKRGGRFYYREPVSDFIFWRGIRALVYRFAPALDHETERPLLYDETIPILEKAGLTSQHWKTHGFFGFCLFMNSDVLVFNRLFRFIPGIRTLTRWSTYLDEGILSLPGMKRAGLQVIGIAEKRA